MQSMSKEMKRLNVISAGTFDASSLRFVLCMTFIVHGLIHLVGCASQVS